MRLFAFFKTTALLLPLALFAGCASTSYPANPQYAVVCKGGAAFEAGKNAYDAEIGGYWLYGKTGSVHIEPLAHALAPEEKPADLVLNIRTAFDTHAKSDLKMVYINSGKHIITARPGESAVSISPGDTAVSARTDILNNTGYIKFKEDGPHRKIILSGEFLKRYANSGALLKWFDH
ncbi:MAG: hypothetical protein LBT53_06115 [Puniceicoccales bacterium]|jgi:hypothetical protein|nr:hypothetical protein [Puniceicoccales bacterium]